MTIKLLAVIVVAMLSFTTVVAAATLSFATAYAQNVTDNMTSGGNMTGNITDTNQTGNISLRGR